MRKKTSRVSVQYSGIHRSLEDIKGRIAELNEVQQVESQRKKKEKASAKYSARKKQHGEEPDDDVEIPARAVKRKSKQNNVSDILADSVQIKRKQSELRQRGTQTSGRRAEKTATLPRIPAYPTEGSSTETTHDESRYYERS